MTLLSDHADVLYGCIDSVLEGQKLDHKSLHEVQSTMEAILSVAHRAIAAHSERWNERTAFFPPELLVLCFEFLGFDDCLRVSAVTRLWRRLALSTPVLWSSFTVPLNFRPAREKIEELLRRSQPGPLSLRVYDADTRQIREALRPHFARIRSLECDYLLGDPEEMPLLERLECRSLHLFSDFVLDRSALRLRVLRLDGLFHIDPVCPTLWNLREFSGLFTIHTSLPRLLSLCPRLESLAIKCDYALGVDPRSLFVTLPPSLAELSISGLRYEQDPELDPTGAWAGHHFRLLDIRCMRDMSSGFRLFESSLSPSEKGWSLDLTVDKKISYNLRVPTAQMRVEGPGHSHSFAARAISNLQQSELYLRRLTSLRLPLRFLGPCIETGIALPALTDLTLTVHPERDHEPAVPDAGHVPAMILPRLQSLTFLQQRGSSHKMDFKYDTLHLFFRVLPKHLRLWMQYDSDILESIALVGTMPDPPTVWHGNYPTSVVASLARTVHIGQSL